MRRIMLVPALLALTTGPAFAHVGAGSTASFVAGVAHPATGIDHIAVMVATGLWAALKCGRALWVWPATFIGVMLAGSALGMAHVQLPYLEPAILASVVALGILVALANDLPVWAGALVIGAFAVFHGHAHGSEVTETVSGAEYLAGFAATTASLHGAGIAFALLMTRLHAPVFIRMAGGACALIGAGLFSGVL